MQISSLKMEARVSLTQSLSIISLFPSLALKHLLHHCLRPTASLTLRLRAVSNVINAAKLGTSASSTSVRRRFSRMYYISFLRGSGERGQKAQRFLISSVFTIATPQMMPWVTRLGCRHCFWRVVFVATTRLLFKRFHGHRGNATVGKLNRTEEIKL